MAISSQNDWFAAQRQMIQINKTASRTSVANIDFGVFDQAGSPGAGTLAIGNTANGLVPTDATAGYPIINPFQAGAFGYISKIEFGNSVICNMKLYDTVFAAGAYAFNADVTLASQPSFSSRVPVIQGTANPNYNGLELWIEAVTAFTGNQTAQINYLDQDGNAGDTGAIATGVAPIAGRMLQLPLASGDGGVSQITRVRSSVSTVGTFNVYVLRPLWSARVPVANFQDVHDLFKTGFPRIYEDSALRLLVQADSTATGLPRMNIQIVNG
jgi:hypothetical protein